MKQPVFIVAIIINDAEKQVTEERLQKILDYSTISEALDTALNATAQLKVITTIHPRETNEAATQIGLAILDNVRRP